MTGWQIALGYNYKLRYMCSQDINYKNTIKLPFSIDKIEKRFLDMPSFQPIDREKLWQDFINVINDRQFKGNESKENLAS